MLYLENGFTPIRFILMSRRLNFLWYILQQEPNSLLNKFFSAQLANPKNGDWVLTVKNDLVDLQIDLNFDDIQRLSKSKFKNIIKEKTKLSALQYLSQLQETHTKSQNIKYKTLNLQDYLKPGYNLTIKEKAFIFAARTRMVDLHSNFKQGKTDLSCRKCPDYEETQEHSMICKALSDKSIVTSLPNYQDLFSNDKTKVGLIGRLLMAKFKLLKSDTKCKATCTDIQSGAATENPSVDLE